VNYELVAKPDSSKMVRPEIERGPIRYAYQVMTSPVLALKMTDTVESAWRSLSARRVRQTPVMDRAHTVVGMVSERDLLTVIDWNGTAPPVVDDGGDLTGIVSRGDILRATLADPLLSLWT
jgi:acetoin utilization protein AcuB